MDNNPHVHGSSPLNEPPTYTGFAHSPLPENLVNRFPDYGRAEHLTLVAPSADSQRPKHAFPLDLETPLVGYLLKCVQERGFDGLFACSHDQGNGITTLRLRAQDTGGRAMAERITLCIKTPSGCWEECPPEHVAYLLLDPIETGDARLMSQADIEALNRTAERLLSANCVEKLRFWLRLLEKWPVESLSENSARGSARTLTWQCERPSWPALIFQHRLG